MAGSDRSNRYAKPCARCGDAVAAEAGVLLQSRSKNWVVYHPDHAPPSELGGVTSHITALRTNQRDGQCENCGVVVPAGLGVLLFTEYGGWDVCHPEHVRPPGPPSRGGHPGWHRRPLMAVDIATTGNRYGVDRILGAAVRTTGGTSRDWLIDPGPGALSVAPTKHHGITLDEARAKGMSASQALDELATVLASHLARTEPLVAWHAPFVLTTLETELLRHELTPLADRVPDGLEPICDPLVLDRQAAPFRFGGHSLEAVTEWYGVTHDRPGHPGHDAKASLIVAYIIGACYPAIGRLSRPTLHQKQAHWHERQMQEAEILHPSGSWGRQWPTADVHVQPWQDQPA